MTETGTCECGCGFPTALAKRTYARAGHVKGEPLRFIRGHQCRKSPVAFVVDPETGCWNWQRAKDQDGYGRAWNGKRQMPAHCRYYEILVGPIPEGLQLDHLCRNHACINPSHLEPVTVGENLMRGETINASNAAKTHCKHGHAFDAENTYIRPDGARHCRACRRIEQRAYVARRLPESSKLRVV